MNSFENHKINLQHTHESVTSLPNYPLIIFLYINNILVPSYDGIFFVKIIKNVNFYKLLKTKINDNEY